MSNPLTEEEKRLARNFRKTALKGQGYLYPCIDGLFLTTARLEIDLSAIARTSGAVSTSPTARVQMV